MPETRLRNINKETSMDVLTQFITLGIGLLLTLASGFWLSRVSKPYNDMIFNIHKLIALGTIILTAYQLNKLLKNSEVQLLSIALIVLLGILILALFTTGALMSLEKLSYEAMHAIHRFVPIFLVICLACIPYIFE
jgi:hypothetical protein